MWSSRSIHLQLILEWRVIREKYNVRWLIMKVKRASWISQLWTWQLVKTAPLLYSWFFFSTISILRDDNVIRSSLFRPTSLLTREKQGEVGWTNIGGRVQIFTPPLSELMRWPVKKCFFNPTPYINRMFFQIYFSYIFLQLPN